MRIITSLSRFYYERIVCFTKSLAFPGKPPEISRGLPHQPSEDVIVRHEGRQRERRGRLLTRSAAVILEEEHATGQHYPFPSGGVRSRRTVALLRVEEKPTTLRVTTSCNRIELTPAPKKKKKKKGQETSDVTRRPATRTPDASGPGLPWRREGEAIRKERWSAERSPSHPPSISISLRQGGGKMRVRDTMT